MMIHLLYCLSSAETDAELTIDTAFEIGGQSIFNTTEENMAQTERDIKQHADQQEHNKLLSKYREPDTIKHPNKAEIDRYVLLTLLHHEDPKSLKTARQLISSGKKGIKLQALGGEFLNHLIVWHPNFTMKFCLKKRGNRFNLKRFPNEEQNRILASLLDQDGDILHHCLTGLNQNETFNVLDLHAKPELLQKFAIRNLPPNARLTLPAALQRNEIEQRKIRFKMAAFIVLTMQNIEYAWAAMNYSMIFSFLDQDTLFSSMVYVDGMPFGYAPQSYIAPWELSHWFYPNSFLTEDDKESISSQLHPWDPEWGNVIAMNKLMEKLTTAE